MPKNHNDITKEDENILDAFFVLKEEGKFKDAFNILSPLASTYPESYKIHFLLGSMLFELEDFKQAKGYLKKAVSLNPVHMLSSMCLVHVLCNLREWHTAFEELRRYLSIDTKNNTEHLFLINELFQDIQKFSTSEKAIIKKLHDEFSSG